jgi:hypothetical protein
MLRLMRKAVPVPINKQPSLPTSDKTAGLIQRNSWLYWYDPIDLISTILSATSLTEKMHFGMAHFVDEPTEYWHSRSWSTSCISTSGEYAYMAVHDRKFAANELDEQARKEFLTDHGMRLEPSPIIQLAPTLDLIHGRGFDAPHSEWRELGRVLQGLLFSSILTKAGCSAYPKAFQIFQFPP